LSMSISPDRGLHCPGDPVIVVPEAVEDLDSPAVISRRELVLMVRSKSKATGSLDVHTPI